MATLKELINSEHPVLVDFYAEWCNPCKTMSMILKELKRQVGEDTKIVKIDVEKYAKVAQHFKIKGVPTLIIFKDGEIKWRESGVHSVPQLVQILDDVKKGNPIIDRDVHPHDRV